MGRYRPPSKPGSPYITPEGYQRLQAELKHLWRVERPEVTRALAAAAAEGDRSENAEYTYRKKQLGGIDRRIRYLAKRLDQFQVVKRRPDRTDKVYFGAWMQLVTEAGDIKVMRIVGCDETDAERGFISVDSPFAITVLGLAAGAEFTVGTPAGEQAYELIAVSYSGAEDLPSYP